MVNKGNVVVVVVVEAAVFLTLIHCGYQDNDVEVDSHEDISTSPQSAPLERRPVGPDSDVLLLLLMVLLSYHPCSLCSIVC